MANKCIVRQLTEAVSADAPILNELRIKFFQLTNPPSGSHKFAITVTSGDPVEIKVVKGSGTFTIGSGEPVTSATLSGYKTITGSNNDFEVSIADKSRVYSISCEDVPSYQSIEKGWGIDVSQLDYSVRLNNLVLVGNKIENVLSLRNDEEKPRLALLRGVFVDLDTFNYDATQYTNTPELLKIISSSARLSKGNIINLTNYTQLNEFVTYSPLVVGEIDDLCAAQVAKGRTSGYINFGVVDSGITDGGNVITRAYMVSKGGTTTIKATFSDGSYTKTYS